MKAFSKYFLPIGLMAGTIIGAGVFSLPFVFQSAGLSAGFFYLVLATAAYSAVHLMYADVAAATSEEHRFVGYARFYLGRWAGLASVLTAVVEGLFILTIYLILSVSFANLLLPFGGSLAKIAVFWLLGSIGIFLSLRRLAAAEAMLTAGIAAIIAVIFALGLSRGLGDGILWLPNWGSFFVPLAPILFSFGGRVAVIPALKYCRQNNLSLRPVIIWGTVLPAFIYALFVLGVTALSGNVSPDAVSGLVAAVPVPVLWIMGVLGLLSLYSSYIVLGLDVEKTLLFDLKFPDWARILTVVGAPLALYLAGFKSFIGLISFVGGFFIALEAIFIIFMWLKAKNKKPTPAIVALATVFIIAIVYEIIK